MSEASRSNASNLKEAYIMKAFDLRLVGTLKPPSGTRGIGLIAVIGVVFSVVPATFSFANSPTVGGCPVFPADNIWNTPINQLPVDPRSRQYVASIGADKILHPDFGSGKTE